MKRRTMLRGLAAAAIAATWPKWIQQAFAEGDHCATPTARTAIQDVSNAFRAAAHAGKPLLVFVIPANASLAWERGHVFGELLNNGSDEALAPLGLAHVVCAQMSALRKLVPSAPGGEPLMVVVETDKVPARALSLDAEVPGWADRQDAFAARFGRDPAAAAKRVDEVMDRRIAVVAELLRKGLAADDATIERRIQRSQLHPNELPSTLSLDADEYDPAFAERVAPTLYAIWARDHAAGRHGARGAAAMKLLADCVRARLVKSPIQGARWARSEGCGVTYEDSRGDDLGVKCGMGYVPEKSQRFLSFYWR